MKKDANIFSKYLFSLQAKRFVSEKTLGRRFGPKHDEDAVFWGIIDPFVIDAQKIKNSKFFRRLADKTQVFTLTDCSHIRTRASHTMEVAALAIQAAHILGLNYNLVEAGALGHDLGHAPFGHLGERRISEIASLLLGKEIKFRHEIMSVVAAQKIERSGLGLNLSFETLEIMLNHSRGRKGLELNGSLTEEANLVMFCDKIAYTFSDLNDALRLNFFAENELPEILFELGANQRERLQVCLQALIKESSEAGRVSFNQSEVAEKFEALRQWSYDNFYIRLDGRKPRQDLSRRLTDAFELLFNRKSIIGLDPILALAILSDREAWRLSDLRLDFSVHDLAEVEKMSFAEIIQRLPNQKVDIFKPDLRPSDFSRRGQAPLYYQ